MDPFIGRFNWALILLGDRLDDEFVCGDDLPAAPDGFTGNVNDKDVGTAGVDLYV